MGCSPTLNAKVVRLSELGDGTTGVVEDTPVIWQVHGRDKMLCVNSFLEGLPTNTKNGGETLGNPGGGGGGEDAEVCNKNIKMK